MKEQRLEELFQKYIRREATEIEERELMQLLTEKDLAAKREELVENAYTQLPESYTLNDIQANQIFQEIIKKQKVIHRLYWKRIAIAASIVLAIGVGTYFLFFNHTKQTPVAKTNVIHDVPAPNVARATLKLDDGRIIFLDSAANGSLAQQGNINVVKLADGKIVYRQESGIGSQEVKYHTISNPRGSIIQTLTLIDGTQVWLNAESSITYPTSFVGNERKVNITGEAYFEVTKDATKKFIVDVNGVSTEVLGTHFNVNSYTDETSIKVTLLEGSVKVSIGPSTSSGGESSMIKPGEQAQVSSNIKIARDVDLNEVMAWKNGLFQFNNADLQTVVRQLARWYDLDVSYEGKIPARRFEGKMQRNLNLSDVLDGLSKNQVHYTIEGKKIILKP